MFDTAYRAVLSKVGVYADMSGPTVARRVWMELERQFDNDVASDLGEAARDSRKHLEDQALKKAILPIDALETEAVLTGLRSSVRIKRCRGVKITAKAGRFDKDTATSDPPTMVIEFDFPYSTDIWSFLGENSAAYVDITLEKTQGDLFERPEKPATKQEAAPEEKKTTKRKKKAEEAKAPAIGEFALPKRRRIDLAGDDEDENQVADSPEEAEEMRQQRLAVEASDDDADNPAPTADNSEEGLAF